MTVIWGERLPTKHQPGAGGTPGQGPCWAPRPEMPSSLPKSPAQQLPWPRARLDTSQPRKPGVARRGWRVSSALSGGAHPRAQDAWLPCWLLGARREVFPTRMSILLSSR